MELTPELVGILVQTGGGPVLLLLGLYYFWTHGVKREVQEVANKVQLEIDKVARAVDKELSQMSRSIDGIRRDLSEHRDAILTEQSRHRERLAKLDIIVERLEQGR